ncbi:lysophospholipase L1-like esterase [Nakamurella sp. UYEF19]|uniref:SGNH/GDSL hydrolase family protein n=1 Tax=Nakamurella sp. UYEF19 TaxID=1756392 RepID=UPI003390A5CF
MSQIGCASGGITIGMSTGGTGSEGVGRAGSIRMAVTAAAGFGVVAGMAGAAVAALLNQARATVRVIEQAAIDAAVADGLIPAGQVVARALVAQLPVPRADGVYLPDGSLQAETYAPVGFSGLRPIVLAMLGDSTAVGYGTRDAAETPGVMLAKGLASELARPVRLQTHGLSGCGASDLPRQIAEALPGHPDVVVIVVGANDIRNKVPPKRSADHLGEAVRTLRAESIPVVVGTCPDFGVIEPIPQPLRSVLHTWSMLLATLQERAVLAEGGRSVPVGRLVSPEFANHPELFAGDHFHPSGAGYAKAVAALLPPTLEELRGAVAAQQSSGAA